ncbi:MAG TPA: SidA/IucD/PvdA family monooxygenase [Allosphingosinicella sp.]|nr:SidA/IucD/PvdA family monooxygenase [Allosphingosinicella sp.]
MEAQHGKRLLVVGAGPKAAAIAAKSHILRELEQDAPEVWVLEQTDICANWTGEHGFTNGKATLGTPPEKDIGFPYMIDKEPEVTKAIFSRFSWGSYKNFEQRTFGEWIDRGRPHPTHENWADYITRVINQTAENRVIFGSCDKLEIDGDEWIVHIKDDGDEIRKERFSGVVITGPGTCKRPPFNPPASRMIHYGDDFWQKCDHNYIKQHVNKKKDALPIIVVGGGETAAAIVSYLVDQFDAENPRIYVLTRSGAIFSRGEGYYENRRFTEALDWCGLQPSVRREVIDRADRGVFSVEAMRKLSLARRVEHQCLEVKGVRIEESRVVLNPDETGLDCQMLVWALGFDPFWFIKLLPDDIQARFDKLVRQRVVRNREARRNREIEALVGHDLSLPKKLVPAKLYVPMISGFAQGPGFPNLSCLGDLSDRILGRR